jgi:hypothetical protein
LRAFFFYAMKNIFVLIFLSGAVCSAQYYPSDEFSVTLNSGDRTIELAEPLYQTVFQDNWEKDFFYGIGLVWRHNFDANFGFRIRTTYTKNQLQNSSIIDDFHFFDQSLYNQTIEVAPGFTYGIRISNVELYSMIELPYKYIGKVEIQQTSPSPIFEPAYTGYFPSGWSIGLGFGIGSKLYLGKHFVLGIEMHADYSWLSITGDYTRIFTNMAPYPIFQSTAYSHRSVKNPTLKTALSIGFVF